MTISQPQVRDLLTEHPLTINALAEFFDAYLSTLHNPLMSIVHRFQDNEIEKGDIVQGLTQKAVDSALMREKLKALRALHNSGDTVTVTLMADQADRLELATAEVPCLLGHAENVFALLCDGFAGGFLERDYYRLHSFFELSGRAFKHAAMQEGEAIAMFDRKLREAMAARLQAQAEAQ